MTNIMQKLVGTKWPIIDKMKKNIVANGRGFYIVSSFY